MCYSSTQQAPTVVGRLDGKQIVNYLFKIRHQLFLGDIPDIIHLFITLESSYSPLLKHF